MGAMTLFDKYALSLGSKKFDFTLDTLKVMLSNTLPNKGTAQLNTDITEIAAGNGYTAGGNAVPSAAFSLAVASYSVTDLAVDGTLNTKVTSATHTFLAAEVGTYLHVTAGTGWTAGYYQITAVSAGAATLDRSPAAVSTTGGSASHASVAALTGNAVVFTASGGSIAAFQYAVLYDSTSGYLIGYWDYGTAVTITTGNTFTVSESGQATGGLALNVG